MILKGNQRAGASQMGFHLLRADENDHVEVHEIRGFVSRNVVDALREAYAVSRGSKCKQFMFSLSLNPPEREHVPVAAFEKAIDEVEVKLGLTGQPRVIVFHEKEGRRHAHCVWSRIRPSTMTAINMAHTKLKLRELSRQIYLEHGWKMPHGLVKSEERNPLNFSREEWQQAKRINRDPKVIKQIFQDCWATSDSLNAFRQAMEARGYYLAKGNRRGHVAIDWTGEIYAVARWVGIWTNQVRARLGDSDELPPVEKVRKDLADRLAAKQAAFAIEIRSEFDSARMNLMNRKRDLVAGQRGERRVLREKQTQRWAQESRMRAERFRSGLRGLWDRVTGRHSRLKRHNELEVEQRHERDQTERQQLVERQLEERRLIQKQIRAHRARRDLELARLQESAPRDVAERIEPYREPPEKRHRRRGPSVRHP